MKKAFFIVLLFSCFSGLSFAQQLLLEGFVGRNITRFDAQPFKDTPQWYSPFGFRLAAGSDRLQLGAEFQRQLTHPSWSFVDPSGVRLGSTEFNTTYYGGFLRTKICKYPAMRFGLVIRAGAGVYQTDVTASNVSGVTKASYDQTLGFTGGLGFSFPIAYHVMLELGYAYHYVDYAATDTLDSLNGSFHSIQAGTSLNFVFGKRQEEYRRIRDKSRHL